MLIPSIDLERGRTVQLVGGETPAIDAGDPVPLARCFGRVGEVAVIDLDAARGRGTNAELLRSLLPLARCRVGGGIRDLDTARAWLDAGASRIIVGTAVSSDWMADLPRDRIVAALDTRHDEVVDNGWQRHTGQDVFTRLEALRDRVGGFLVTFVEHEGRMEGIDLDRARALREAAGDARLTVAGGLREAEEIAALDALGIDVQVGMALYTGALELADAFLAPMIARAGEGPWPTVVCDEEGRALGLVYSDRESVRVALASGRGVYHSRRRGLWVKGESSGNTQELLDLALDCDRDALRARVRQEGEGFCHLETRSCWGEESGVPALARRLQARRSDSPPGSYTRRLLDSPALLDAKLLEEMQELVEATTRSEVVHEAADVVYFTLVRLLARGASWEDLSRELDRRAMLITRRPGDAKPGALSDEAAPSSRLVARGVDEVRASAASLGEDPRVREQAAEIVDDLRRAGEPALLRWRERLDGIAPSEALWVGPESLRQAFDSLDPESQGVLERTADRIADFARAQRESLQELEVEREGLRMGHRIHPVDRAGCYAPGGRHPLPSSLLMTAVVARAAGVGEVVVATPSRDPHLWAAAHVAGVDGLLWAGGAQAIAALAFGTESVAACEVVVGPGNAWVSAAKSLVAGQVRIDALAGPSELVVVADGQSDAALVARDLLAQAEHDLRARPGLVALEDPVVEAVNEALEVQLADLATADVARVALAHSFSTVVGSTDEAIDLCNALAPEHLQWMAADTDRAERELRNYGGLFVGSAAAEVLGDYGAGPNHTLPTSGQGRVRAGLSVFDFLRLPTFLASGAGKVDEQLLSDTRSLARMEGLLAHERAAAARAARS